MNLYALINTGKVDIGDRVIITTGDDREYGISLQAIKLDSEGVYVIGKDGSNLCLAFNHRTSPTCAYVGFREAEILALLDKWLTNLE